MFKPMSLGRQREKEPGQSLLHKNGFCSPHCYKPVHGRHWIHHSIFFTQLNSQLQKSGRAALGRTGLNGSPLALPPPGPQVCRSPSLIPPVPRHFEAVGPKQHHTSPWATGFGKETAGRIRPGTEGRSSGVWGWWCHTAFYSVFRSFSALFWLANPLPAFPCPLFHFDFPCILSHPNIMP